MTSPSTTTIPYVFVFVCNDFCEDVQRRRSLQYTSFLALVGSLCNTIYKPSSTVSCRPTTSLLSISLPIIQHSYYATLLTSLPWNLLVGNTLPLRTRTLS